MPQPSSKIPTARIYYFDYLRVWATVAVVLLHTAAGIVVTTRGANVGLFSNFNVANAYDSTVRFAVNCFFMISGALLLSPTHVFRLRKQFLRVFWPLLTWSITYALVNHWFVNHQMPVIAGANDNNASLLSAAKAAFTGPLAYHLWFVYALLGIYLVLPLLRPLTALPPAVRTRLLHYALTLWFIFSIALPTVYAVRPDTPKLYWLAIPDFPSLYLGVVLLGFYLHHRDVRIARLLLVGGALGSVLITAWLVFLEQVRGDRSLWPYDYYTPQVVLCTACVFLLAKSTFDRPGRAYPFISLVSRLSYRIYLIHILVLHVLTSSIVFKGWYHEAPIISIPVLAAATLVLSFAISWLLDRIRPVAAYV